MPWLRVVVTAVVGLLVSVAAPAYVQSGTCYTSYGISITSCSDLSGKCTAYSCSGSSSVINYSCSSPRSCTGIARYVADTPPPSPQTESSTTYNGYDQSGTCYSIYGISISSCNDLNGVCSSRSCYNMNNAITFSCFGSISCSGSASPATPAPTPSTAQSGNCIVGRGLHLTTCAETSSFRTIGCTCYKCNEVNGYIQLSCSAPFVCSNTLYPSDAGEDTPKLNTKDYAIICSVFVASAGLFGVVAWLTKPKAPPAPPTSKTSVSLLQRAWDKVVGAIREYAYEPNVRDDGSFTTLCEFAAFMNPMLSLISQLCCCCFRPRDLPPHYKPPITKMRALAELVESLCLVTSIAFLLGTVVNNSEACSSSYNGDRCEMDGVTIDNRVSTTTTSGMCQSVDSEKTIAATIVSTVLTKSVGIACSYAEKTAKDQPGRMRWIQGGRIVLTVGLLAFGFAYSYHIVSKDSGSNVAKRRSKTIMYVLVPTWAADQATSIATLFGQRLSILLFTCVPKDMRAAKVDEPTGPAVCPATENIQLQPPEAPANALAGVDVSGVVVKVTAENVPWGDALDAMVRQTEAVTVVWNTPP